jgi:DNA polymerase alpha subunit B
MNATTVLLEGSRATCGGARIEVDLRHLKSDYSLFPGQIVAIEGHNTTGRSIVAQRLCEGAPHPANTTSAADLFRYHYQVQDGAPLHIVTASGPFTTSDNLDYQPLVDLIGNLVQSTDRQPDVVILTGPFVDLRHPDVASGNTTFEGAVVPFEVLFCHKVAQVLEEYYETAEHATQFILQPNLDDATAQWV